MKLLAALPVVLALGWVVSSPGHSTERSKDRPRPPQTTSPHGKWNVEFANGVKEGCDFFRFDDEEHVTVDEPRRRSRGKVILKDGSAVLTFNDNRVERWTPVGNRYVVEHWFPATQVPVATPVLGIAERAQ